MPSSEDDPSETSPHVHYISTSRPETDDAPIEHFNFMYLGFAETCPSIRGKRWAVTTQPTNVECETCKASPIYQDFYMIVEVGYDGKWGAAAAAVRRGHTLVDGQVSRHAPERER